MIDEANEFAEVPSLENSPPTYTIGQKVTVVSARSGGWCSSILAMEDRIGQTGTVVTIIDHGENQYFLRRGEHDPQQRYEYVVQFDEKSRHGVRVNPDALGKVIPSNEEGDHQYVYGIVYRQIKIVTMVSFFDEDLAPVGPPDASTMYRSRRRPGPTNEAAETTIKNGDRVFVRLNEDDQDTKAGVYPGVVVGILGRNVVFVAVREGLGDLDSVGRDYDMVAQILISSMILLPKEEAMTLARSIGATDLWGTPIRNVSLQAPDASAMYPSRRRPRPTNEAMRPEGYDDLRDQPRPTYRAGDRVVVRDDLVPAWACREEVKEERCGQTGTVAAVIDRHKDSAFPGPKVCGNEDYTIPQRYEYVVAFDSPSDQEDMYYLDPREYSDPPRWSTKNIVSADKPLLSRPSSHYATFFDADLRPEAPVYKARRHRPLTESAGAARTYRVGDRVAVGGMRSHGWYSSANSMKARVGQIGTVVAVIDHGRNRYYLNGEDVPWSEGTTEQMRYEYVVQFVEALRGIRVDDEIIRRGTVETDDEGNLPWTVGPVGDESPYTSFFSIDLEPPGPPDASRMYPSRRHRDVNESASVSNFRVGDRVRVTDDDDRFAGEEGVVHAINEDGDVGVRFDRNVGGHTLGARVEQGHGFWFYPNGSGHENLKRLRAVLKEPVYKCRRRPRT